MYHYAGVQLHLNVCFEADKTLLVTIGQLCKNRFLGSAILLLEILNASFGERRDACDVVDASLAEGLLVYRRISFLTKDCGQNVLEVSFLRHPAILMLRYPLPKALKFACLA